MQELIQFVADLVRIPSYSDQEGPIVQFVKEKMIQLGFDEVYVDRVGNVVGRMGQGKKILHFDSHVDTVKAEDANLWTYPPFSGAIVEGYLYGRGSVDMKAALGASIYAAHLAKASGCLDEKTVYVTGSICEEYCDGVNLQHFYKDSGVIPDACIICEPSNNLITLGHTGKIQARIKTKGVSAHGSAPEKGVNAVYAMAEVIQRVEQLNARLSSKPKPHGTIVLSDISSVSASLNAVPSECSIYLDRRLVVGETLAEAKTQLDELITGKDAHWEIGTLTHTSWTGESLVYQPIHEPWNIDTEHALTKLLRQCYAEVLGKEATEYNFWDFGTNAVTPLSMGVPTIGFGPGDYKLAHMVDERVPVSQLAEACAFYLKLIEKFH